MIISAAWYYLILAQTPWSTFADPLGRARDALAQADGRPGQSPICITYSP